MSHWYRFFPGDYMRDTMHLGWYEDCAYRRLIDLYHSRGKPIANDRQYIMRAIRANEPEQQTAADNVLTEFFILGPDGWHQKKCDDELYRSTGRSDAAVHANKVRWNKNKQLTSPDGVQPQSGWIPNQNQKKQGSTSLDRSSESDVRPVSSGTRIRASFSPPTLEQVKAYILEKGYDVDPAKWINYYTANGWKVGRNPMKDWQAAVRTWTKDPQQKTKTESMFKGGI